MENQDKTQLAVNMLKQKYNELGRFPKKEDFGSQDVCFIKQKLGPWPRALEKAGIKTPPEISSAEKNKLKRKRVRKNHKLRSAEQNEKLSLKTKEENQ